MYSYFKLLLFLLVFFGTLLAGYKGYLLLNKKISESNTLGALAFYALLLFAFLALLFSGSLYLLIVIYGFLITPEVP